MNVYVAIGCGEYFCKSGFPELIAAWLNASQRSRDSVELNRHIQRAYCKTMPAALNENSPGIKSPFDRA